MDTFSILCKADEKREKKHFRTFISEGLTDGKIYDDFLGF